MAPGDVRIEHPNRDRRESRMTRAIVVTLLLISDILLVIVTVGGWEKIQGAKPVQLAYIVIYALLAFHVARWRRGLLPVVAAFAIILLIFAAISAPEWFARDREGFANPPLDESIVGLLTLILIPLQLLLIAFAASGFAQKWSVEVERRVQLA
jgi:prepilin signal peptidase PulO-like enzyme (type II secretory pathway)